MAAKPIVDGIEAEHGDRLRVIRLNVQEPVGSLVGRQLGFEYTPTFILFEPGGEEIWRTIGTVDPAALRDFLAGS